MFSFLSLSLGRCVFHPNEKCSSLRAEREAKRRKGISKTEHYTTDWFSRSFTHLTSEKEEQEHTHTSPYIMYINTASKERNAMLKHF